MYFDGASTQNSAGAGVVLISPSKKNMHLLGVKAAKEVGIMCMKTILDLIHLENHKNIKTFKLPGILELQPRGVSLSDNNVKIE